MDLDPTLKNIYGKLEGDELFIINEVFKARGFRKIHIEIAKLGSSLDILHAVFFPDPRFDLPIFGVDIVSSLDVVSAAIVDLSPVDTKLSTVLEDSLQEIYIPDFRVVRKLPEWGDIFSPYVVFIKPSNQLESALFLDVIRQYLGVIINHSLSIDPNSSESPITIERYKRQHYYCQQQKCNDKTRNVLAKIFGDSWADKYIELVLFDCPSDINQIF